MTREEAEGFALRWAGWWNAGAVESVLEAFSDDVVFVSPTALAVMGSATVRGKPELRAYWTAAMQRIKTVQFTVGHIVWDPTLRELAIVYTSSIAGATKRVSENLRFDETGKIVAAEVFHGVAGSA